MGNFGVWKSLAGKAPMSCGHYPTGENLGFGAWSVGI